MGGPVYPLTHACMHARPTAPFAPAQSSVIQASLISLSGLVLWVSKQQDDDGGGYGYL